MPVPEGALDEVGEGLEAPVGVGREAGVGARRQHHGAEVVHEQEGVHGLEGLGPMLAPPRHEAHQGDPIAVLGGQARHKGRERPARHGVLLPKVSGFGPG